jgi:phenylpyruvate tautomerase PptA (4-oxalocrotonate tautomerase family)
MPSVLIETRCQRSRLDEAALIDAVHQALVHAFKIPEQDRDVRLLVHEPHRFACPANRSQPALFTLVNIDAFEGRSLEAKRLLYRTIVGNLAALDIPADHITILLREIPTTNWGLRGGQAACDIDLGFKIAV